jgi:hypothetical protein
MATYEMVDGVVDAMIARIQANITALGGTSDTPVIEGDELPERITVFPSIFVLPLISRGDQMTTKMGGVNHTFHEFSISIAGVYRKDTVSEFMRTCRQYGYTCSDLFSGPVNYKVTGSKGGVVLLNPNMQPAYYRVVNNIIHTWMVELTAKSVTP